MKYTKWVLAALLLPAALQAQAINYHITYGTAADAACSAFVNSALRNFGHFYAEEFGIVFIQRGAAHYVPEQLTTMFPDNRLAAFYDYANLMRLRPGVMGIAIVPPMRSYGVKKKRWIGGMSQIGSLKWGGPAVVWTSGAIPHTATVLIHEVGHAALGLPHKGNCSWMDRKALSCKRIKWNVTDRQRAIAKRTLEDIYGTSKLFNMQ